MSALGSYVHLYTSNYLKYGTSFRTSSRKPSAQLLNEHHQRMMMRITAGSANIDNNTIAQLKELYESNNMQNVREANKRVDEDFQRRMKEFYAQLDGLVDSAIMGKFQGQSSNYGKGAGRIDAGFGWAQNQDEYQKYWGMRSGGRNSVQRIAQKSRQLQDLIKEVGKLNGNTVTESQLKNFINRRNQILNRKAKFKTTGNKVSDFEELQNEINAITIYTSYSQFVGDMGEYLAAMADNRMKGLTGEAMMKMLNQIKQGNRVVSIDYQQGSTVSDTYMVGRKLESGAIATIGATKQKIDVDIQFNGVNILGNVKNYWSANKVQIQDRGINLANSLIAIGDDFGNHWLNLNVGQDKSATINNWYEIANKTLQLEMAYEALSIGNPLKRDRGANVFISFDRSSGKVIVKRISDIILYEIEKITGIDKPIGRLNNEWQPQISSRLANLIMQAKAINYGKIYYNQGRA